MQDTQFECKLRAHIDAQKAKVERERLQADRKALEGLQIHPGTGSVPRF